MLRANGDLDGAREAAKLANDPSLLKAILVEQRDWAAAAKLQAAGPCPPVFVRSTRPDAQQRAERLGRLAAYQRLAGQTADFGKTIGQIQQLAGLFPNDHSVRWFCVEALLLNDRVDEGVRLLADTYPMRAFDLYTYRHKYRKALALAKWRDDVKPDRAWLDSLPTVGSDEANKKMQRFDFALKVTRTLHVLGQVAGAGRPTASRPRAARRGQAAAIPRRSGRRSGGRPAAPRRSNAAAAKRRVARSHY